MKRQTVIFSILFGLIATLCQGAAAKGVKPKLSRPQKALLQVLDRSIAATERFETLSGEICYWGSSVVDPSEMAFGMKGPVVFRRMAADTVLGFQFSSRQYDLDDSAKMTRVVYDGDNCYYTQGDTTMTVDPAQSARSSWENTIIREWPMQLRMLRESMLLPDSLFQAKYPNDGPLVGAVELGGDTVLDGRPCYLIRSYKEGTNPRFKLSLRHTYQMAIDKATALPVYLYTRSEAKDPEMTTDQVLVRKLSDIAVDCPAPDSLFVAPSLPLRTQMALSRLEAEDSTLVRWNGGVDVLGRWDGQMFSDSTLRGKIVVMDFSYKGCGFCQIAWPVIDSLAGVYDGRAQFLLVDPVDSRKVAAEYARTKQSEIPMLSVDKKFAASFGMSGYPSFVILNREGRAVFVFRGYPGNNKTLANMLTAEIEKLLNPADN